MSLFDALRYPVSDLPTTEELKALPKDLYERWMRHPECSWSRLYANPFRYAPTYVAGYAQAAQALSRPDSRHEVDVFRKDTELLRKLIKEYEPI